MNRKHQLLILTKARLACFEVMNNKTRILEDGRRRCPVAWDDILCWPEALAGTVQTQRCPDYIHGFNTKEYATKTCTENGTWFFHPFLNKTWTDFGNCVNKNVTKTPVKDLSEFLRHAASIKLLYTVGYGVSLASLLIAVFIMCWCRRLKSKSNTLHVNLFLAFILRAALSFALDTLFVDNLGLEKDVRRTPQGHLEFITNGTHWECRTMVSMFIYSICASQMWIFMEGLYLHMLIYRTLSTERRGVRLYVITGWLSPLLFFIPWVAAKSTSDNNYCWTVPLKPDLRWIYEGPLVATVILNLFFFLNILRVLVSRVRATDRHIGRQHQYRRLAKFILVLVPLFGVSYIFFYIVFPMSFATDEIDVRQLYIEMAYNSFQGFVLALLFCFLNEEVHAEIRRMWMRKWNLRRESMAVTRSFALSSFRHPRQTSFHLRSAGQSTSVVLRGSADGDSSYHLQPLAGGGGGSSSISHSSNNISNSNNQNGLVPRGVGAGPDPRALGSGRTSRGSDSSGSDHSSGNSHHHLPHHQYHQQHRHRLQVVATPAAAGKNSNSSANGTAARKAGEAVPATDATSTNAGAPGSERDWLDRMKKRALVIFWRQKSSDSREGVIDTRYDCDGVPDIDAETPFAYCGPAAQRLLASKAALGDGDGDEKDFNSGKSDGEEEENARAASTGSGIKDRSRPDADLAEDDKMMMLMVIGLKAEAVPLQGGGGGGGGGGCVERESRNRSSSSSSGGDESVCGEDLRGAENLGFLTVHPFNS